MDPQSIAVIVVAGFGFLGLIVTALIAPQLTASRLARTNAEARAEDYRRQDEVADRAARAAAALQASQQELISQTSSVAAGVKGQVETLNTIHGLVDGGYTAALQAAHDSTERELAALAANVLLLRQAKQEGSPEYHKIIAAQQASIKRLGELASEIDARGAAAKTASDTAAAAAAEAAGPQEVTIVQDPKKPVPVRIGTDEATSL